MNTFDEWYESKAHEDGEWWKDFREQLEEEWNKLMRYGVPGWVIAEAFDRLHYAVSAQYGN